MLYRDIILKVGNKLNDSELSALKAVLVINIGKFSFLDKEDAITAIRYCSNLKEEDARPALKNLEDLHGVIAFDDNTHTYDLIAEANGFNEFKRIFTRYRLGVKATIDDCSEEIRKDLSLDREIETAFAQDHHISSTEWNFARSLVSSPDIDEEFMSSTANKLCNSNTGEAPRGLLIYAYCDHEAQQEVSRISKLFQKYKMNSLPIIILFLDDSEQEVLGALAIIKAIKKFSVADAERFQKHISTQLRVQSKKVCNRITSLVAQRVMIDGDGLHTYSVRLNVLCSEKFNDVFPSAPPFMFDGFEKKTTVQAKKYLTNICIKLFDRTLMNVQSYQALTQDEKNRVKATLSTKSATSWQVFDDSCCLIAPQNKLLKNIYDEVEASLSFDEAIPVQRLFGKFSTLPYGMNDNALSLFIIYFIVIQGTAILSYYGQEKLVASHLSDKVFNQGKLQKSELLKIRLQMNANASVDVVTQICNEILTNTIVEKHNTLKKKLSDMLVQDGISTEYLILVSPAQMSLDETLKQNNDIYSKLEKAKGLIDEAEMSLVIHKFINVFDYLVDTEVPIVNDLPFVYSEEYKQAQRDIEASIKRILNQKFSAALRRFKCNITQLSQVKSLYKNAAKVLRERDYSDLATETDARIEELEQELLAKQKYESSIVECEKDLSLYSDVEHSSLKKCNEIVSKMQGWKSFLNTKRDLPESISEPLVKRINFAIESLNTRIVDIQTIYASAIDEFINAKDSAELRHSEVSLKNLSQLELDDKCAKIIAGAIADISAALKVIADIPENLDEIESMIAQLQMLEPKSCQRAIGYELGRVQDHFVTERDKWLKKYIEPAEEYSKEMTASDCTNWLDKTLILPAYLDTKTIERYKEAAQIIELQLHSSRIQGVVSMFSNLTDSEKTECLKIISQTYQ